MLNNFRLNKHKKNNILYINNMNKSDSCKIYHNSEYVSWSIPKKNIEKTLLGSSNKKGLLYLNVESAGEINFEDSSCKIDKNSHKICNKQMKSDLIYKNGKNDSVMTPLAVVNFHTHPLSCYIDAETIWGWPSGEDMAQCLNFAKDNNVTHLIFAIEGTYVIDVNNIVLHFLQTDKKLYSIILNNIEEIFKLTHKHRMINNESNPNIELEYEFNEIFLKPLGLIQQKNILLSWIYLVNNLTLDMLIILSNELSKYFKEIKKIPAKLFGNHFRILKQKIFSLQFFKNETIQWSNNSKEKIFSYMKQHKNDLRILLPEIITYKAPFISNKCKL